MRILLIILLSVDILRAYSSNVRKLVEINSSPQELITKIDSIEKARGMEKYKLDYFRSFAYFSMTRFTKSVNFADSVLNSNIPVDDSVLYFNTYMLKAESLLKLNRLEETALVLKKAMHLSKRACKKDIEANVLFMQGVILRKMGSREQGYKLINDAIRILSEDKNYNMQLRTANILGYISTYYINDEYYDKAVEALNHLKRIVDSLCHANISSRMLDIQYGYYYAKMAYVLFKQDRRLEAEEYYQLFKSTEFFSVPNGKVEINPYLLCVGKFHEVINNNNHFFLFTETEDVSSSLYQRSILESAKAYEGMKDYEWAYYTLEKYSRMLSDELNESDKNTLFEHFNEVDNIYSSTDNKNTDTNIVSNNVIFIIISLLSLVLIMLLLLVYKYKKNLKLKNIQVSKLMLEISTMNDDESVGSTEQSSVLNRTDINLPRQVDVLKSCEGKLPANPNDNDEILFKTFHNKVVIEKLYLNYQLQRDDYSKIMGVDKNHFASIIKEYTGSNLNSYLNEMRLDYSVYLFRTHPEMSISEVGEACALPSSTTFYRLFKEKYGISPNMFRNQIIEGLEK